MAAGKRRRGHSVAGPSTPGLRARAEARLRETEGAVGELSPLEARKLVQELQVSQIEVDIQNQDLREAQLELANSHDRLADLYDFAPVGYLTLDADGRAIEANLTAAAMIGVDRSADGPAPE